MEPKPGTEEYRKKHIKEMQAWPLDKKINHSLKRIREFYEHVEGKVYVAFSGGKDSTVLLHLVRSLYPDVVAVFSNTTNELPEILDFVRTVDNVITVHPKKTFNQTLKEYGFPLVSKQISKATNTVKYKSDKNANTAKLYETGYSKNGRHMPWYKISDKWMFLVNEMFNTTNKCCDILKKEPSIRFEQESGLFCIMGTMATESDRRKADWVSSGCNNFGALRKTSKPLSIWTEEDIWEYIRRFNVPYSSAYDDVYDENGKLICKGEKRTGCAYCGFGAHLEKDELGMNRFQRLSIRKPKQYETMMKKENNGVTFEEALNKVGVKTRVKKRLF